MLNEISIKTFSRGLEGIHFFKVEAGTNCPQGGSDHRARTIFRLIDFGSTRWEITVRQRGKNVLFENLDELEIVFFGDAERWTFIKALKFALSVYRGTCKDKRFERERRVD